MNTEDIIIKMTRNITLYRPTGAEELILIIDCKWDQGIQSICGQWIRDAGENKRDFE